MCIASTLTQSSGSNSWTTHNKQQVVVRPRMRIRWRKGTTAMVNKVSTTWGGGGHPLVQEHLDHGKIQTGKGQLGVVTGGMEVAATDQIPRDDGRKVQMAKHQGKTHDPVFIARKTDI